MIHEVVVTLGGNDNISKNLKSLRKHLWEQIQVWSHNEYTPRRGVINNIEINVRDVYFRGCDGEIYKTPTGRGRLNAKFINHRKFKEFILKRDNFTCQICGIKENRWGLCVDHIITLRTTGTNSPKNLQALCSSCNSIKGNTFDKKLYEDMIKGKLPDIVQYQKWLKENRSNIKKRREK